MRICGKGLLDFYYWIYGGYKQMNTTIVLGRLTADPESIKGSYRFNIAVEEIMDRIKTETYNNFLQITTWETCGFCNKYCIKVKISCYGTHIK